MFAKSQFHHLSSVVVVLGMLVSPLQAVAAPTSTVRPAEVAQPSDLFLDIDHSRIADSRSNDPRGWIQLEDLSELLSSQGTFHSSHRPPGLAAPLPVPERPSGWRKG